MPEENCMSIAKLALCELREYSDVFINEGT
jgi:hypothetical protein